MAAMEKESREDQATGRRMPDVIHLAPTLQVDSPIEPVIIEDMTGYEVIKGRYSLVITIKKSEENLVDGERIDADVPSPLPPEQQKFNQFCIQDNPQRQRTSVRKKKLHREPRHRDVAQAFSLLWSTTSSLSDITFPDQKDSNAQWEFERVRMSL